MIILLPIGLFIFLLKWHKPYRDQMLVNKKIKLRALWPLAVPFQSIKMDNNLISVKEKGVITEVLFGDISSIKVYSFMFYPQMIGLSWIKDIILILKSGKEIGLFNCKKDAADFLVESVKMKNQNVIINPESINATIVNGLRLARSNPLVFVQKSVVGRWLFFLIAFFIFLVVISIFLY
jgi:hypothetical protein